MSFRALMIQSSPPGIRRRAALLVLACSFVAGGCYPDCTETYEEGEYIPPECEWFQPRTTTLTEPPCESTGGGGAGGGTGTGAGGDADAGAPD